MRSFICLEIPDEIKKILEKIQGELPPFEGKKTEKENFHLTLKFLGEISEENLKEIKECLSKIKFEEFKARLGKIGVFNRNFIRIIWVKIENCEELQKKIDESIERFFKKEERFMSHLTIARVKSVKNKEEFLKELEKIVVEEETFSVREFFLKKSTLTKNGPIYEDLAVFSAN